MIGPTRQVAVWAYGAPADLRNGFDSFGLAAGSYNMRTAHSALGCADVVLIG